MKGIFRQNNAWPRSPFTIPYDWKQATWIMLRRWGPYRASCLPQLKSWRTSWVITKQNQTQFSKSELNLHCNKVWGYHRGVLSQLDPTETKSKHYKEQETRNKGQKDKRQRGYSGTNPPRFKHNDRTNRPGEISVRGGISEKRGHGPGAT